LRGQAVHAAARVADEAVGGQILATDDVRKHAEPEVDWSFLDSGLFWLRGFPERWLLYEVSWSDTSAGTRPARAPGSTRRRSAGDRSYCASVEARLS
jgi:class 3 adenylate cyclase